MKTIDILGANRFETYTKTRAGSRAVIVRGDKILLTHEKVSGWYLVPGGGIEEGETPEEAALRELKEECGLDGTIVRPLAVQYKTGGGAEYSFEVSIPAEQEPVTGYDPEETAEDPPLKEVLWMALDEISEKDRAFLWSYGLISVAGFFDRVKAWGNAISYPHPDDGGKCGRDQEVNR